MRHNFILAFVAAVTATPTPQGPPNFPPGMTLLPGQLTTNVTYGPAPKGCSKYELIIARGTGEPGPFGAVTGDPLVAAVTAAIPDSRGYAAQYPANFNFSYSPSMGVDDIITRLNTQNSACPDQKFALVGYSQGAGVIHGVFGPTGPIKPGLANPRPVLDTSVIPKVLAVVLFGDPGFKGTVGPTGTTVPKLPSAVQEILIENCAPGDPVCDPKGSERKKHLAYIGAPYQAESAAFVIAAFKGEKLPESIKEASDPVWVANAEKTRPKGTAAPPS
ncbi:carbohydrate esterase family 5 protein [Venturia nashicola]|uniref:Carbohydrate esterase family 5 protein n=1 Tax=Venturia nashicola TaxID=86259 RepID=A0A4Z1PB24_9PEZI|nr:carbohydrate esterase family 5 protein [Venturia nashicola]TLD34998.1 carbohydrate esterase family 5 protein [Venturia nashicola]